MVQKNKALVYVTLFSLSWAALILVYRHILSLGIHPLVLTSQVSLFTSVLYFPYFLFILRKSKFKISKETVKGAGGYAVLGTASSVFAFYGLQHSTAVNYGFLIKTSVVFAVVLAYFFLEEAIPKAKLVFIVILLLGTYLLSTSGQVLVPKRGDLLIIMSAFFLSSGLVWNRKVLKKKIHPDIFTYFRLLFGIGLSMPLAFLFTGSVLDSDFIGLVLFASVFQILLVIFLNRTLSVASASYAAMMSMVTPVIVVAFAIPLFGESLNFIQIIGAGMIITGGVLTQIKGVASHD